MATNFERSPAVEFLSELPKDDGVEIEVVVGDVPIEVEVEVKGDETDFYENIAEHMDEDSLSQLASELIEDFENDLASRKEWEDTYRKGIELLGLKYEEMTQPFSGACGVTHPLLTEVVVRFQAEAIMETFPAEGPVKTRIIGEVTPEKTEAACRVKDDMNYQITEVMTEFRPEYERLLWELPIVGSAFKKVYYDETLERPVSLFVPAEDVILPYGTTDITRCERLTHRMRKSRMELMKLQEIGFYRDISVPEGSLGAAGDGVLAAKDEETGVEQAGEDDSVVILEMHVERVIPEADDDESPKPYIVTVLYGGGEQTVLSIRRNWDEFDTAKYPKPVQYFVHYVYVPGFGSYGYGLIHLIGNSARAATSILRQLVDAGTLATLPGGFKTRGLRIKGDDVPFAPGEWRDVDIGPGTLKDNIMPLPYKEPSATLASLLDRVTEEARRLATAPDLKYSDMSAQAPVGTTLALLERSLKVMSAVQARLHYSLKQELRILARLFRDRGPASYGYDAKGDRDHARREDYSYVDVIPVSDPNASTLAQRVVQYQAVVQLAAQAPQIYDLAKLHRRMLEVLGIDDAEDLVPVEDDMEPTDPVTENMNILVGKPVKAFLHQDHEAHIRVHMAAMQDPVLMQLMGQNPQAQMILQAAHAHLAEHIGFEYRKKIQEQMGVVLPPPDEPLPPQVEVQLSALAAQAADQLLGRHQAQAQAERNAQMQNDPIVQMQQAELQIKAKEAEIKEKKVIADAAAQADKIALEREKLRLEAEVQQKKLQLDDLKLQLERMIEGSRLEAEGVKLGVDIAKSKAEMAQKGLENGQDRLGSA